MAADGPCAELVERGAPAKGAIAQLELGVSWSASTNRSALGSTSATFSGVSTVSVATSIALSMTFSPRMSSRRSNGTCEWMHSNETMSIDDCCGSGSGSGNDCSYSRHPAPSVSFQLLFASML